MFATKRKLHEQVIFLNILVKKIYKRLIQV